MELAEKMPNIVDYARWRGDLGTDVSPFNAADALILARVSYFPLESLLGDAQSMTFRELGEAYGRAAGDVTLLWPNDGELIPLLAQSPRYSEWSLSDFVNVVDVQSEKQFSAVTIDAGTFVYASFRGTDSTMVGWREDFNMSFRSHVPSQIAAKEYLEEVAAKHPSRSLVAGGHSKGGNVAIYAMSFCDPAVSDRVTCAYNFDGPGFLEEIVGSERYLSSVPKIKTFVPQGSIFGMLMDRAEPVSITRSTATGFLQHDVYTWETTRDGLALAPELEAQSVLLDRTLTQWLAGISDEEREIFTGAVFDVIESTGVEAFREMGDDWFGNISSMLDATRGLDGQTKMLVLRLAADLVRIGAANASEEVIQRMPSPPAARGSAEDNSSEREEAPEKPVTP